MVLIGMLYLLSIGAVFALIPIVIIVLLIAAAVGLNKGSSIFALFGFDVLLGMGRHTARRGLTGAKYAATRHKGKIGSLTVKTKSAYRKHKASKKDALLRQMLLRLATGDTNLSHVLGHIARNPALFARLNKKGFPSKKGNVKLDINGAQYKKLSPSEKKQLDSALKNINKKYLGKLQDYLNSNEFDTIQRRSVSMNPDAKTQLGDWQRGVLARLTNEYTSKLGGAALAGTAARLSLMGGKVKLTKGEVKGLLKAAVAEPQPFTNVGTQMVTKLNVTNGPRLFHPRSYIKAANPKVIYQFTKGYAKSMVDKANPEVPVEVRPGFVNAYAKRQALETFSENKASNWLVRAVGFDILSHASKMKLSELPAFWGLYQGRALQEKTSTSPPVSMPVATSGKPPSSPVSRTASSNVLKPPPPGVNASFPTGGPGGTPPAAPPAPPPAVSPAPATTQQTQRRGSRSATSEGTFTVNVSEDKTAETVNFATNKQGVFQVDGKNVVPPNVKGSSDVAVTSAKGTELNVHFEDGKFKRIELAQTPTGPSSGSSGGKPSSADASSATSQPQPQQKPSSAPANPSEAELNSLSRPPKGGDGKPSPPPSVSPAGEALTVEQQHKAEQKAQDTGKSTSTSPSNAPLPPPSVRPQPPSKTQQVQENPIPVEQVSPEKPKETTIPLTQEAPKVAPSSKKTPEEQYAEQQKIEEQKAELEAEVTRKEAAAEKRAAQQKKLDELQAQLAEKQMRKAQQLAEVPVQKETPEEALKRSQEELAKAKSDVDISKIEGTPLTAEQAKALVKAATDVEKAEEALKKSKKKKKGNGEEAQEA